MVVSDQLVKALVAVITALTALLGSYWPTSDAAGVPSLETSNVPTLPTAVPAGDQVLPTGPPQVSEAPEVAAPTTPAPRRTPIPPAAPTTTAPAPVAPAPVAPAPAAPGSCQYPAQVLDLSNWKLTLPIAGSGDGPAEITQPELDTFTDPEWFTAAPACDAAIFRAPVDGVTTSGSKNPRSELREMAEDGSTEASWSSTSGTHTLVVNEAFTKLPEGKPHLVGAQIHDSNDDVTVFRLEGASLYITDSDTTQHKLITDNYVLGTPFEAKFVVAGGQIEVYYNGMLQTTLSKEFSGGYFKAGAYTQANCSNAAPCSADNYGETTIYGISATHS